jgi:cytochrome c peroxidase
MATAHGGPLRLVVSPEFSGENVQPASLRYRTAAGEAFSICRLSYLISDVAFQLADGTWREFPNSAAWLDLEGNRDSLRLEDVPDGIYRAIRFDVGLAANLNHSPVGAFPPGHPLNPNENGLHWSWQGGFVFLAMEGLWRNAAGQLDGWVYHLAGDANRARIVIDSTFVISNTARLDLDFDAGAFFRGPNSLAFQRDGSSTHSREGDRVAASILAALPHAFHLRSIARTPDPETAARKSSPLYLPRNYVPFHFRMAASFPIPKLPGDNPLTLDRVTLGEKLFHETALSRDRTISCASCHQEDAGLSDARRFSVGVGGQQGRRRAMPLFNLAWKNSYFWDGRAPSLRAQALAPIEDQAEMNEPLTNATARLAAREEYRSMFLAAFGSSEVTSEKIGLALEAYLLTLTSFDSKFDRVLRGAEKFTGQEQRGFQLFATENDPRSGQFGADCFHCHGGALFRSQSFANNGLDSEFSDLGRAAVTGKESDKGKFAVPSLRNVAERAPFMHDGRFKTLEETVQHYCTGIKRSPTLDPNLARHPDGGLHLDAADQKALVAFLRTLSDQPNKGLTFNNRQAAVP